MYPFCGCFSHGLSTCCCLMGTIQTPLPIAVRIIPSPICHAWRHLQKASHICAQWFTKPYHYSSVLQGTLWGRQEFVFLFDRWGSRDLENTRTRGCSTCHSYKDWALIYWHAPCMLTHVSCEVPGASALHWGPQMFKPLLWIDLNRLLGCWPSSYFILFVLQVGLKLGM